MKVTKRELASEWVWWSQSPSWTLFLFSCTALPMKSLFAPAKSYDKRRKWYYATRINYLLLSYFLSFRVVPVFCGSCWKSLFFCHQNPPALLSFSWIYWMKDFILCTVPRYFLTPSPKTTTWRGGTWRLGRGPRHQWKWKRRKTYTSTLPSFFTHVWAGTYKAVQFLDSYTYTKFNYV